MRCSLARPLGCRLYTLIYSLRMIYERGRNFDNEPRTHKLKINCLGCSSSSSLKRVKVYTHTHTQTQSLQNNKREEAVPSGWTREYISTEAINGAHILFANKDRERACDYIYTYNAFCSMCVCVLSRESSLTIVGMWASERMRG